MKLRTLELAILTSLFASPAVFSATTTITGAGATFPASVYMRWAEQYAKAFHVQINYQAIGSGGGIKQIQAGTVDFGASDKPLTKETLEKNGLVQFPTVLGAVVPVVNLPNVKSQDLKLDGQALADIFQGKIIKWSDPTIKKLNPDIQFPDQNITVIHRSDGSGTTFLFTNYLTKVSQDWAKTVGSDVAVNWPVGIGGKGNEGVAMYVKQMPGAIGYVEYSYAVTNKLSYAQLKNKDNNFVKPSMDSVNSAAKFAKWDDPYVILTDEPGANSWPITGATFILMHANIKQAKRDRAKATLDFFDWAYHNGNAEAESLHYVTLPTSLIQQIETNWKQQIKDDSGKPIWDK